MNEFEDNMQYEGHELRTCEKCNTIVESSANFCFNCGHVLPEVQNPDELTNEVQKPEEPTIFESFGCFLGGGIGLFVALNFGAGLFTGLFSALASAILVVMIIQNFNSAETSEISSEKDEQNSADSIFILVLISIAALALITFTLFSTESEDQSLKKSIEGEYKSISKKEVLTRPNISFQIMSDDLEHQNKRVIDVSIKEPLEYNEIVSIAKYLKSQNEDVMNTFILYWLNGVKDQTKGAWGTSHFNPRLSVNMGASKIELSTLRKATREDNSGKIIGKWIENDVIEMTHVLKSRNGKYYLTKRYADSADISKGKIVRMYSKSVSNGLKLWESKDAFEFYILTDSGYLECYDKYGLVSRGRPFK